jgi:hypothetical protein
MAEVAEHLPNKCEALSSSPSIDKNKRQMYRELSRDLKEFLPHEMYSIYF